MDNGSVKNFYSFATKYWSHHKPLEFPIYDSYVDQLLRYFRDTDGFFHFRNDELKSYTDFKNILIKFGDFYNLEPYSLKDIDDYFASIVPVRGSAPYQQYLVRIPPIL